MTQSYRLDWFALRRTGSSLTSRRRLVLVTYCHIYVPDAIQILWSLTHTVLKVMFLDIVGPHQMMQQLLGGYSCWVSFVNRYC